MKQLMLNTFLLVGLLASFSVTAQEVPAVETEKTASNLPYEIVVTPNVTRGSLRRLIMQVEDDFVEKFNELNIDDAYDVLCYKHMPTMSHGRQRICEPAFLIKTRGDEASEAAFILASKSPGRFARAYVQTPSQLRASLKPKYENLQSKLEELTRGDVELRQMGAALNELTNKLNNFGEE